jgi:ATP-dependent RNA helicase DeaD
MEKSTKNKNIVGGKRNKRTAGHSHSKRRERHDDFVESFQWGFVEGADDNGTTDSAKSNNRNDNNTSAKENRDFHTKTRKKKVSKKSNMKTPAKITTNSPTTTDDSAAAVADVAVNNSNRTTDALAGATKKSRKKKHRSSAAISGQAAGQVSGQIAGQIAGQVIGQVTGQVKRGQIKTVQDAVENIPNIPKNQPNNNARLIAKPQNSPPNKSTTQKTEPQPQSAQDPKQTINSRRKTTKIPPTNIAQNPNVTQPNQHPAVSRTPEQHNTKPRSPQNQPQHPHPHQYSQPHPTTTQSADPHTTNPQAHNQRNQRTNDFHAVGSRTLFRNELDDEDDLNLPSYGRSYKEYTANIETKIEQKIDKKIEQKIDKKIDAKADAKIDNEPKKTAPEISNKLDSKTTAAPTAAPINAAKTRPTFIHPTRSTTGIPATDNLNPTGFSTELVKPRREQMVWDPDKREYVPLKIHGTTNLFEQKFDHNIDHNVDHNVDHIDRNIGGVISGEVGRSTVTVDETNKVVSQIEPQPIPRNQPTYRKPKLSASVVSQTTHAGHSSLPLSGRVDRVDEKVPADDAKSLAVKSADVDVDAKVDVGVKVGVKRTKSKHKSSDKSGAKSVDRVEVKPICLKQQRGDVARPVASRRPDPADIESEAKGFASLGLSDVMLEALQMLRYLEPTPIQAGVFDLVKSGKDLMGQAHTGTGKTAAFAIPIIEGIEECPPGNDPVALILVPTRELAVQVRDEIKRLAYGRDIRIAACYGGKPIAKQISKLREGVDIVVGTPGRLLDLINRRAVDLGFLKWVVLDEADRMLDIGFRPDIEKLLKKCPETRQTLLFSATLPPPVVQLAEHYMRQPTILDFSNKNVSVDTIEQFYVTVEQERKFDALVYLLNEEQPNQAIIFTRTKRGADRLARLLSKQIKSLAAIHGDLLQADRDKVMSRFRAGELRYLVATDVVGRGIDVSGISHIINYDIPHFCDDYVHRVGRTGRMGREGVAYTFVTAEEGNELTRIEMRIEKLLKRAELKGFESFSKPAPNNNDSPDKDNTTKPVFGKPVRKIRRAL